jgi:hypothetical protein
MKVATYLIVLLVGLVSFKAANKVITVTWVEKVSGDFSFSKRQSISCDAWCYEWAGTNSIVAKAYGKDTVQCYTAMNEATHCSLSLLITRNNCIPTIVLKSIAPGGDKIYQCKNGYIKIDQVLWKQNILKAEFDFDFVNDENDKKVFWKGKIYTRIR